MKKCDEFEVENGLVALGQDYTQGNQVIILN